MKTNGETKRNYSVIYNVATFSFFLSSVWTGSPRIDIFFLKSL